MSDGDDTQVQEEGSWLRSTTGVLFAAAVALLIGMIGGGVTGVAIGWIAKPDVETSVPRDLTPEELASACAQPNPDPNNPADPLTIAQKRVADLERGIADGERKVAELEQELKSGKAQASKLQSELTAARQAVQQQKEALAAAVLEKEELLGKLSVVSTELAEKTVALDSAREQIIAGRWTEFLTGAVQEICDKGNRKKLGDCRTVVKSTLGTPSRADRFTHCLRSGQAAPALREWDANLRLPPFAEHLDENRKEVRGWIVIFCDPTLPELAEGTPG